MHEHPRVRASVIKALICVEVGGVSGRRELLVWLIIVLILVGAYMLGMSNRW